MKQINWSVKILNPVNKNHILETNTFRTIEEIFNKYPNLPLSTWRNICIGRSKIYKNFINVDKMKENGEFEKNGNILNILEKL